MKRRPGRGEGEREPEAVGGRAVPRPRVGGARGSERREGGLWEMGSER